jgi:hypothetical protein
MQFRALALYRLTQDPLLLDAIRVLQNPNGPHYDTVLQMIELMEQELDAPTELDTPE